MPTQNQIDFAYDIWRMLQLEKEFKEDDAPYIIGRWKYTFYRRKNKLTGYDRILYNGYSSLRDRLDRMFWGSNMPTHDLRELHTTRIKQVKNERKLHRKQRKLTFSKRALKTGSKLLVVYPSGKTIVGKIVKDLEYALVEPCSPNTAAFLFDEKYSKMEKLDLTSISHERIIHSKKGIEFIKDFQDSKEVK